MVKADYRGARGSNAGDSFHELWAVRHTLRLLESHSSVTALTLEGLQLEDESTITEQDSWEGVDCCLYIGGDRIRECREVVVEQMKYSSADPQINWTIARLTRNTRMSGNNSVLRRLAQAFSGILSQRGGVEDGIVVRLVSNQPVDPHAIELFSEIASGASTPTSAGDRDSVSKATGLSGETLRTFARALDLSSRTGSRFQVEETALKVISSWTDDVARTILNTLLQFVRGRMLPESKGERITAENLLLHFNFSSRHALFPCPSEIRQVNNLVPRTEASRVIELMMQGKQHTCLHGTGGCGKTTALQEIEARLPSGSAMCVFDCYGAGRYLDSNAKRHRPQDAFLQLSNDLAAKLRIPLLLQRSRDADYPRAFHARLNRAAEAVSVLGSSALLVIAIDAADNAVAASKNQAPVEAGFIDDFIALGPVASNVRIILTTRTGRLDSLNLPNRFECVEMKGFTRNETGEYIKQFDTNLSSEWVDTFHYFTSGNPRVQSYAIQYGGGDSDRILNYLRPEGKSLGNVFEERFSEAIVKAGAAQGLEKLAAALIVMPRPIPFEDLAHISEFTSEELWDICSDLAPAIRIENNRAGFADEDFEYYVRERASTQIEAIRARVADWFEARRTSNVYAALNVASALYAAGRGQDLIRLVQEETEPTAIPDPILRREAQINRLRLAIKVSIQHGNDVDAVKTILVGAEALKTDTAIRDLVASNPDLAITFMRESAEKAVLLDPARIDHHGPMLFHQMLENARIARPILVRESHRQLAAWLRRRQDDHDGKKKEHPHFSPDMWKIDESDVAAQIEAILRVDGLEQALGALRNWRPLSFVAHVAQALVRKLIVSNETSIVEQCLTGGLVGTPWNLMLLVPLALSGRDVDVRSLQHSVVAALRYRLAKLDQIDESWMNEKARLWPDLIMNACELAVARGGDRTVVASALERICDRSNRREGRLLTSQSTVMDILIRAHALREAIAGRSLTSQSFLVEAEGEMPTEANKTEADDRFERERRKEMGEILHAIVPIYATRAGLLVGAVKLGQADASLAEAIKVLHSNEYKISRRFGAQRVKRLASQAIASLIGIPEVDSQSVLKHSLNVFGERLHPLGDDEIAVFHVLSLSRELHETIVRILTERAEKVRQLRTVSRDKVSGTLQLARSLLSISRNDAEAIFVQAHQLTEEIDVDGVYQLDCLGAIAGKAAGSMTLDDRRKGSQDCLAIVTDAAIRLSEEEGFPWWRIVSGITRLNLPTGLAAVARWEDTGVVERQKVLPGLLETALLEKTLSPEQSAALFVLLDFAEPELFASVVKALAIDPSHNRLVIEHLAREELLFFGWGARSAVFEVLRSAADDESQAADDLVWLRHLRAASQFDTNQASLHNSPKENNNNVASAASNDEHVYALSGGFRLSQEVINAIRAAKTEPQPAGSYFRVEHVLKQMRQHVPVGERTSHLDALSDLKTDDVFGYNLAVAIGDALEEWRLLPAVRNWASTRLEEVIADRLFEFTRWLQFDDTRPVGGLLKFLPSPPSIRKSLIDGISRNAERLTAASIYKLVIIVVDHMQPAQAAEILCWYQQRLISRIPSQDVEKIAIEDLPLTISDALARFLYALMSDCDVRERWRSAHAMRALARLGDSDTMLAFRNLYDRTSDPVFRAPNAPFYWLAARTWLMIAINRITHDAPEMVADLGGLLVRVAISEEFPHVLIRSFAKDAAWALVQKGFLQLSAKNKMKLQNANTTQLRRRKVVDPYRQRQRKETQKERRFHFDSMDTLPYWYEPATRMFANVTVMEFTGVAEKWIVDQWKAPADVWRWDAESRKNRFPESNWGLWGHSHGGEPTLERYSTHLEWHGMFCAVGDLLKTKPLIESKADDWNSFERWLKWAGLAVPPWWLADLRCPKPLESRFWQHPPDDAWIDAVVETDFLLEIGVGSPRSEMIAVHSWHETGASDFNSTARISTALVQPDFAHSLVRALQTATEPFDYAIPGEGGNHEIDEPPYRLVGWLAHPDSASGIDEKDLRRNQIGQARCVPGPRVLKTLKKLEKRLLPHGALCWETPHTKRDFVFEQWSDRPAERGDEYPSRFTSNGARLWIKKDVLLSVLTRSGLDLIVEVELTRRKGSRDYQRVREEKATERRYDRVLLLRKSGAIEAAEGRIGTWYVPRKRAKSRPRS